MLKQVYKIDNKGYVKEIYVANFDGEGNCLDELEENVITTPPPDGLYRAKWTGVEWVEDMTLGEIDELNNHPKTPSDKDRIDMLENMILLMMMEG